MVLINLITHYTDIIPDKTCVCETKLFYKWRDDEILNTLHNDYKVPRFPMTMQTYIEYSNIVESISKLYPFACFIFVGSNQKVIYLQNNMYGIIKTIDDVINEEHAEKI